jgi:hypothetical protein
MWCVAVAMATAVEASDVAMRYVTEAERCPTPHQNIACDYCELFLWSLKLNTYPQSTEKIKNAWIFNCITLCAFITILHHWWLL